MNLERHQIHEAYPYLAERTYLNTAAAGISWVGEGAAAAQFYEAAKSRGYNGRELWQRKRQQATQRVRTLLGGFDGDIEFFSSTSEVLNLVAHSVPWESGDEVVLAADEFPSVVYAWQFAEKFGAKLITADVDAEAARTDKIVDLIGEKTRVVAVSHVHWATGTKVELGRIGEACRKYDALLVVDGIQALGAVPVDMTNVDVYCSAVFKWLCSGFGLSIAALSARATEKLCPSFLGYANTGADSGLQYAHVNYPGIYALNATLGHMEQIGWHKIYDRVGATWSRLARGFESMGYAVSSPAQYSAGIVSIAIEHPEVVQALLKEKGIDVEVRSGLLRCSPHFYNTEEDIDRLLEVVSVV